LFGGELLDQPRMDELLAFGPTQGPGWSKTLRYGLGVMSETLRAGDRTMRAYGHTGMLGGYRSALWYLPDRDIVVVALLNENAANPTQLAAECAAAL
jgi:CubicO group peptidase (beta-lactamase class C family)